MTAATALRIDLPKPPPPPCRSRRGRRRVTTIPAERAKHLKALELYERFGVPQKRIAAVYGVSRRTVTNWLNWASEYPEARPFFASAGVERACLN